MIIHFGIDMDIDDTLIDEAKTWEHHAEKILNLDSYPQIKSVCGCHVEQVPSLDSEEMEEWCKQQYESISGKCP